MVSYHVSKIYMKNKLFILIYVLFLGLIPLLWFKGDYLITGTDVNFSPFPYERLRKRVYMWEKDFLTGTPKTHNSTGLSYIATSGFLSKIINDTQRVEKATFFIWLSLTGLSIAFLLEKIFYDFKNEEKLLIKVFGITLYMINFYNVFLWVRLHITITTLVFLPILFGVLYEVLQNNKLKKRDLLILSLATILGGSFGSQPPLIYVVVMTVALLVAFYILNDLQNPKELLDKLKKLLVIFAVSVGSGAYWIFPQAKFIFTSALVSEGGYGAEIYDVEKLLRWTSKEADFLNIFRNFGDIVWLDSWGNQPYFPEFLEFYSNPFFMVLSFLLVGTVFLPFYAAKRKRKTLAAFGSMLVVTLLFSKGIHPPLETAFKWSFKNLPGFWIHRAPWQKFGMMTSLIYAVLGGYGFFLALRFLHNKLKVDKVTIAAALLILYGAYHHLFILGKMFPSKDSSEGYHGYYNLGFHHKFPKYMYETREYFRGQEQDSFNTLLLPDLKTSVYDWGYGSSVDIVSIFINRPTLYRLYGEGYHLEGYISNVYNDIIQILYNPNVDPESLKNVFDFYNIKYILQRNDFSYGFYGDTDSPEFIAKIMKEIPYMDKKSFGEWDLFRVGSNDSYSSVQTQNYFINVSSLKESILLPILEKNEIEDFALINKANLPLIYNETYISAEKTENMDTYEFTLQQAGTCEIHLTRKNYEKVPFNKSDLTIQNGEDKITSTGGGDYQLPEGNYEIYLKKKYEEFPDLVKTEISHEEFLAHINDEETLFQLDRTISDFKIQDPKIEKITVENPKSMTKYEVSLEEVNEKKGLVLILQTDYAGNSEVISVQNLTVPENYTGDTFAYQYKTLSGLKTTEILTYTNANEEPELKIKEAEQPGMIIHCIHNKETNIPPDISYERINPTKYLVEIKSNPQNDFVLELNQTYNKGWRLNNLNGKKEFTENFLGNFYNNSWLIKKDLVKKGDILIAEFSLQKNFYHGVVTTLVTFSGVFICTVITKFRKRGNNE